MQRRGEGSVTLTREELYEQVWTTPIVQLAEQYGMSDRGLAKVCERFRIPRPPRGYWAKRRYGKKVRRAPLRPLKDSEELSITIHRQARREPEQPDPEWSIVVPEALTDPHPLIVRTEKSLHHVRPAENGLVSPRAKRALRVTVAPASIDRAMRILDALVKALEEHGYAVETAIDEDRRPYTFAFVDGEQIDFCLTEKLRREDQKEASDGRGDREYRWRPRYRYHPTGVLSLRIVTGGGWGTRSTWSDTKRRPLEKRLGLFVASLRQVASAVARRRREQEEARRRREAFEKVRAEKLRLIREEEERLEQLNAWVDAWHSSQRIRAHVEAVREAATARDSLDAELERWIAWATAQADRLDPLVKAPPSILDEKAKWRYGW